MTIQMQSGHELPTRGGGAAPMYAQLESQLRRRIESGEWSLGSQIPAEHSLCEQYGVSKVTVRHALQRLANKGLIVRQQGRGSFVRTTDLTAGTRSVRSFTAEVQDLGMRPTSRLLSVSEMGAPEEVSGALGLQPGEPVVKVNRVRLGDGQPIGVQTSYLISARFPGLAQRNLDGGSLYALLQEQYGLTPVEARETFTVGQVSSVDAKLLKVPVGSPAFFVERTTFDSRGSFEYVSSVMRGDRYRVTVTIKND